MDEEEFEEIDLHEIAVARRELSEAKGFGDEDKRRQIEKLFGSAPTGRICEKTMENDSEKQTCPCAFCDCTNPSQYGEICGFCLTGCKGTEERGEELELNRVY